MATLPSCVGWVTVVRALGTSSVRVGPFGFGGVPIANLYTPVPNDVVLDAIRTALDLGIRYFDTAPFYGFGLGERRMGLGLAEVPRDTVVLSTKVGRTLSPARGAVDHGVFVDAPPFVATFDFTGDAILRQVDASLQRLGTDRLDCVVIHDLGLWHMGTTEALEHHFKDLRESGLAALSRLKAEGVIGAIGAGANELTLCDRFLALEQLDFILLALRFTLLDQSAFPRTLDSALRRGKGVVVGAPFQSGILATGAAQAGMANYVAADAELLARVGRFEAIARNHAVSLRALALQFPMRHAAVCSVLAGMRSAEEVRQNMAAVQEPVPAALWDELVVAGLIPDLARAGA